MTWYPTSYIPRQFVDINGMPASGYVLKAYAAGTTTPIPMATDYTGATTALSFTLNALGYPISGGAIIIPHVQENFKMALYPDQASADSNSGAVWTYDDTQIADGEAQPFFQTLSGDGTTVQFLLSSPMGTDEKTLMVFADKPFDNQIQNGTFASDTVWTKGTGWTITGGVAVTTGAISTALTQVPSIPIVDTEAYVVKYTIVTGKQIGRAHV